MPLPWPPPLSRARSRRPGHSAQITDGWRGRLPPQAPWRLGSLSPELGRGKLHSPCTPTSTPTLPQGPVSPQGYKLKCLWGRQAMCMGKPMWAEEAIGTGGACGKLKSKCPSHRGHTWPMAAMQEWGMEEWRPHFAKSPDISKEAINLNLKCRSFS